MCRSTDVHEVAAADPLRVLQELWNVVENSEAMTVADAFAIPTQVVFRRCASCSAEFFHPTISGGTNIYSQSHGDLYTDLRWDHFQILRRLRPGDRIIDFGGGSGRFGLAASQKGCQVTLIDSYDVQPQADRGADFRLMVADLDSQADLSSVTEIFQESADWVTGFHVVEHVHEPLQLLSTMVDCLSEKGRLAVSVPNRMRFDIAYLQPLDCPPHHQSRWTSRALEKLLQGSNLFDVTIKEETIIRPRTVVLGPPRWVLSRIRSGKSAIPSPIRPWPPSRLIKGMSLLGTGTKASRSVT